MSLRDKIASLIKGHTISMWRGLTSPEELSDQILALIAPELEKAKKWDKVEEILPRACSPDGCKYSSCTAVCQKIRETLNQPDEVKP